MTTAADILRLPAAGGPGATDVERLARALTTMSDGVVLSHRTAAALWGLWTPRFDGIEVTTPATGRGSRYTTSVQRSDVVAHRRLTTQDDTTRHCGLLVTTLTRTWLDLAPVFGIHDLVAAGDSVLRLGARTDDLAALVGGTRRVRGLAKARTALPLLDGRSRSRPESRIRCALVLAGLPRPRVNEAIYDATGGWLAEPDLHYREARLAIEYNGADHATVDRMRKDSGRLLDIQREGWEVRTCTAAHALSRLDDVVADVRAVLRRRAPQLLAATA